MYCRHAALMAISAAGEGCHKQMQPLLQEILVGILNFLQDPVSQIISVILNFYDTCKILFLKIFFQNISVLTCIKKKKLSVHSLIKNILLIISFVKIKY